MIGFYVYMLICTLLLPAAMLLFGRVWKSAPPGKINWAYGYRTRRSTSSQPARDFAHAFIGNLLRHMGLSTLAVSASVMAVLGFITLDTVAVSVTSVALVCLQFIAFITSAVLTERALKQEFKI